MASFIYNAAAKEILDETLKLSTDTLKIMLVNSTYTPDRDDDVVDAGGASDPVDAEITATNYTKGWGGAGRKTVGSKVFTEDDPNDQAEFDSSADITWTSLGGAANDTVVGAILIKEGGADDTTSRLIAYFDVADTPTNGHDFILQFNAEGLIKLTTA